MKSCTSCELSKHRTKIVEFLIHDQHPLICYLGESPGKNEDLRGVPFVGAAGKFHSKFVKYIGLPFMAANCVKCRPVELDSFGKVVKNGKPTAEQISICSKKYLFQELKKYKPPVIVLYGEYPIRTMLQLPRNTHIVVRNYVGKLVRLSGLESHLDYIPIAFLSYHPATLVYSFKEYKPLWIKNGEILKSYLEREGYVNI